MHNSANNNRIRQVLCKSRSQQTEESNCIPPSVPVPLKYRDVCRLCFASDGLEPLYSGLIVVRDEMLDRIYLCTGILIVPKSKESAYICTHCAETIDAFFSFRQQVNSNNLAYLKRQAADEAGSRNLMFQRRKRQMDTSPAEMPAKIKRSIPKPLQIELLEQDYVAGPPPEPIPNPLDCEPEIKLEPEDISDVCVIEADPIQLNMTVEWDGEQACEKSSAHSEDFSEELPEQESWTCQQCSEVFLFKFECAKHLLQKHREKVEVIKTALDLDELNTNMLEMMSAKL